jgi:hypothetical protein
VVAVGSSPLGGLIVGWIASNAGVETSLVLSGLACMIVGAGGLVWLRRIRERRSAATADAASPVEAGVAPGPARLADRRATVQRDA